MSTEGRKPYFGNVFELFPGVMARNLVDAKRNQQSASDAAELALAKAQSRPHYDPDNWRTAGNCRGVDPNVFIRQDNRSIAIAKGICRECVVRDICLEDAIENDVGGTRGFYSEQERRSLKN